MADNTDPFADLSLGGSQNIQSQSEPPPQNDQSADNDPFSDLSLGPVKAPTQATNQPAQIQPEQSIKNFVDIPMGTESHPAAWQDVAKAAAQNFLPSLGRAAVGVYEAIRHPMDTAHTIGQLGVGIDSKIEGYAGKKQDPAQKAKDESLVDALADSYKDKYGSLEQIKHTAANDPASLMMDLSAVLGAPEMALGKVPGVVGGAARASGTVGRAVNPFNPLGVLGGTSSEAASTAKVLDRSGNFTPEVNDAIKAATNGKLSAADFIDPTNPSVQHEAAAVLSQKGVTPASINEASLRSQGLDAPMPVVTGLPSAPAAQQAVDDAIRSNQGRLGELATKISGSEAPSMSDVAAHLEQAQINSHNTVQANYAKFAQNNGEFHPDIANTVTQEIEKSLGNSGGLPTTHNYIKRNADLPQADKAMQLIQDQMSPGGAPLPGGLTPANLERIRQQLNGLLYDANGTDRAALRAIIDGYDNNIINSAKSGMFSGDGNAVVADMQAARQSYKNHQDTFNNTNGTNAYIARAVKKMVPEQGRDAGTNMINSTAGTDTHVAAQAELSKKLLHPTEGPDLYNRLVDAMGGAGSPGEDVLNQHVRQSILQTNNGAMARPVKELDRIINTPGGIASKVFTPQELSQLKIANYNRQLLMNKPSGAAQHGSIASSIANRAVRGMVTAGVGHMIGGYPGSLAAAAAEQGAESLFARHQIKSAMRGAPAQKSKANLLRGAKDFLVAPGRNRNLAMIHNAANIGIGHGLVRGNPSYAGDDKLFHAIHGQESGYGADPRTSVTGATGDMQIQPETFSRFAAPGERIDNREDNLSVGKRIIGHLSNKFGGDPDRVAVGYFSGEGNVAPEGHPTPWLNDRADPTGKTTSSYVNDIRNRLAAMERQNTTIQRATGGRVGDHHERLVSRLMTLAEHAKKDVNSTTEPLLNVPDATIVKALHVANQAI